VKPIADALARFGAIARGPAEFAGRPVPAGSGISWHQRELFEDQGVSLLALPHAMRGTELDGLIERAESLGACAELRGWTVHAASPPNGLPLGLLLLTIPPRSAAEYDAIAPQLRAALEGAVP
jgi:hypothetical protein